MAASPIFSAAVGGAIGIIGTLAGACLNIRYQFRQQRVARRADFIEKQLGHFYGPVNILLNVNRLMFAHSHEVQGVSEDVLSKRPVSYESKEKEARTQEIMDTIYVGNDYTERARTNNLAILDRINEHFSYVDAMDAKAVSDFAMEIVRAIVEFDRTKEGKNRLPLDVQLKFPLPKFFDPTFADRIQSRFDSKVAELEGLEARPIR